MLGFAPLTTRPLDTTPAAPGPYVRLANGAVNFQFTGAAPTSTDLTWAGAGSATGDGAGTLDLTAVGSAAHGVAGAGATTLELSAAGEGEYTSIVIVASAAITLDLGMSVDAAHGVASTGAETLSLTADSAAGHGAAGAGATTLTLTAAARGAHGVAGACDTTLTLTAVSVAVHQRYELTGEVRMAGILVNRRVRAYRRDTGALVSEVDTTAGGFKLQAGFNIETEFTVMPIDLDSDATDWTPPVANRVLPQLAFDA